MKTILNADLIFSLSVDCAPAIEVGKSEKGCLFVIPIIGGTFQGDGLGEGIKGTVVPGGADWNTRFGENAPQEVSASHVKAEYLIKTDDGVFIRVQNEGFKSWKDGEQTEIVTSPKFQVEKGKYDYLNYGVYVGSLKGRDDKSGVEIQIFRLC